MGDTTSYEQTQIERHAPYLEDAHKRLLESGETLTATPYKHYAGPDLAAFSADQVAAQNLVRSGLGAYSPYLIDATTLTEAAPDQFAANVPQAEAWLGESTVAYDPSAATGGVADYMDPYQRLVTDEALRELTRQSNIQRSEMGSQAVKAGAYGGSRFGVAEAELGRNLADAQAKLIADQYSRNYAQALAASQKAADTQTARKQNAAAGLAGLGQVGAGIGLQSGSQLAGLGGYQQQYQSGDVQMLSQSGALQRDLQQAQYDIDRAKWDEKEMQPYQRLSYMGDIIRGIPSSQSTMTSKTAPGQSRAAQNIGGIASVAGAGQKFGWWGQDAPSNSQ